MTHACPIARLRLAAIVLLLTSWLVVPLPAQELLKNPGFDQERDGKGLPAAWSASRDQVLWQGELGDSSHNSLYLFLL
jgi:hypothetical protein